MNEPKVYRPNYAKGVFALLVGSLFAVFGALGLEVVGLESWYFYGGFLAMGILVMAVGWSFLQLRVIVNHEGICKKLPRWLGGFNAAWQAIESWSVSPNLEDDSFIFQVASLQVRGRKWPARVDNSEACRPSFDAFLEDLRFYAKEKEAC